MADLIIIDEVVVREKIEDEKNRVVVKVFIIRMLVYSARKNKANGPAAYSTLNPDTSSDSPSVRSNGARVVSASVETYHIAAVGQRGTKSHMSCCDRMKFDRANPPTKKIEHKTIKARVTS